MEPIKYLIHLLTGRAGKIDATGAGTRRIICLYFFSLCIFIFSSTGLCMAQSLKEADLKTGDLLFQDLDCGPMCDAIEAVTVGWEGRSFSHVGIVERKEGAVYIWESIGPGVRSVVIDSFRKRSGHALVVGRVKKRYEHLVPAAMQFLGKNKGLAYDEAFLYNNGKYYCSELIYDAFKAANKNRAFFRLYPMTFKKPGSSQYFPVWINYYQKLGQPIPEGKPGCNPGGLSRSSKLTIVGQL